MPSNEQRRQAAKRKLARQLERRAQRAKRRRVIGVGSAIGGTVLAVALIFWVTRTPPEPEAKPLEIPTELAKPAARPSPLPQKVNCEYKPTQGEPAAKGAKAPEGKDVSSTGTVKVNVETNVGTLPLTLDRSLAPCAVNSMVSLVQQGYYNDSVCHRISTEGLQMLQCGAPNPDGSGGPGYAFAEEVWPELTYGRGYLAMAKTNAPNSTGGQFFIVYGNAALSPDYSVFGTIGEDGLKLVDEVARAGHDGSFDPNPGGGKPKKEVKFTKATVA
ncbi:peptidylprolyl isomerase [Allokutzneria sp. A3M-2-11 16]|uniref:peptidylprolyl isomerase n=1 Tax=Allokutzneria sp. A3M-2-11 16 TaxID=2962043 RepID=UPI0020B7E432|nr:peptidylprolyl isomerase [Allokutzneria sp. A3M-2-11 16]MCP3801327.1 peptidylprolyl isomerase [Allokutzneria sp. A3M-2-11 16]